MGDEHARFADVSRLITRTGPMADAANFGTIFEPAVPFQPMPEVLDFIRSMARVLVVGAGGLGCELLKDLALMGFGNIDVIDMDTIDVSNLNRQFLFRKADVGRPKATVAAEFVSKRVSGVTVTPHYCPIQDKDASWYREFQVIVLGLDSIEASATLAPCRACAVRELHEHLHDHHAVVYAHVTGAPLAQRDGVLARDVRDRRQGRAQA